MIFWLVIRNLRYRLGANLLTGFAVALAVCIALAVPLVLNSLREGTIRASSVFDLLIVAKGSPTQAVMNTIFLQEAPVGNIPYSLFQRLERDLQTRSAVPLGFGDNYNGFTVIGTTNKFFELREKPTLPAFYKLQTGQFFKNHFEAVIGAQAARVSGLKLGDNFQAEHGVTHIEGQEIHQDSFKVVGILEPTGGPTDRAILVPLEAIWADHGQTGETRQVTAVLYTPTKLGYVYQVASEMAQSKDAQGVFPGQVIGRLLDLMGQGRSGYEIIGVLVLVLALSTVGVNTFAAA